MRRALWVRVIVNYDVTMRSAQGTATATYGLAVPQVGDQIIGTREESEPGVVVGAENVADSIVFGGTHVNYDVKVAIRVPA